MRTKLESKLGLSEKELQAAKTILEGLRSNLVGEWAIVGGFPLRYLYSKHGRKWPYPFNDLDIVSRSESVFPTSAAEEFNVLHHHRTPQTFYFQVTQKDFPEVTIDIFLDSARAESEQINLLGQNISIAIPEEMYLFKLRDILLLLDHPAGLPPKHIEELRFLESIVDFAKAESIWEKRHQSPPSEDRKIYEFKSFDELVQEVERELEEKAGNIKEWEKSDPLVPCDECLKDSPFPLLRDYRES